MYRREFLRGLFAAPAIVAVGNLMPVSARLILPPKLWGDGVHDDTAALRYMIDEAARNGRMLVLKSGAYRVSGSLIMPPAGCKLAECTFDGRDIAGCDPMLMARGEFSLENVVVTRHG